MVVMKAKLNSLLLFSSDQPSSVRPHTFYLCRDNELHITHVGALSILWVTREFFVVIVDLL